MLFSQLPPSGQIANECRFIQTSQLSGILIKLWQTEHTSVHGCKLTHTRCSYIYICCIIRLSQCERLKPTPEGSPVSAHRKLPQDYWIQPERFSMTAEERGNYLWPFSVWLREITQLPPNLFLKGGTAAKWDLSTTLCVCVCGDTHRNTLAWEEATQNSVCVCVVHTHDSTYRKSRTFTFVTEKKCFSDAP